MAWFERELEYPRPPLLPSIPEAVRIPFGLSYEPPVDVCEERDRLVVYADLPGVKLEDVKLRVSSGCSLELEATREVPKQAVFRERVDRFYRVLELPATVRPEPVEKRLEEGVLVAAFQKG